MLWKVMYINKDTFLSIVLTNYLFTKIYILFVETVIRHSIINVAIICAIQTLNAFDLLTSTRVKIIFNSLRQIDILKAFEVINWTKQTNKS